MTKETRVTPTAWYDLNEDGGSHLLAESPHLVINGCSMHLEARRVTVSDHMQRSWDGGDWFEHLHTAASADGHFETVEIAGYEGEYVVFATPYC